MAFSCIPATHDASMITEDSSHRFITDTERVNWNDSNGKKHTHSNKTILDTITQILIDKWNSAVEHIADTIKHITNEERILWNTVKDKIDEKEANDKFVTKDELVDTNYGDMFKSVYDTNKNGIVDKAETVEWNGILNKPSAFEPSTHKHKKAEITDFPSSLPADGGNADTLDNKHASDFMKAGPLTWSDLKGAK